MDCFASLAMTTNSAYFRQPHFEPNSQEQHRRALAKAGTKRLEGRSFARGIASSAARTARISLKYLKSLGNGVTVAQQTLTLFV
jgi:hypothetical protein